MNEQDFDGLVRQAGRTTTVRAATLDGLVERTAMGTRGSGRGKRPAVVAVAVAGVVLLAAAASSNYWMKLPPFQSSEAGMYRVHSAIPVDFTMADGEAVRCQAFLEYLNLSVLQSEQAESYVEQRSWSGLGQQLLVQTASVGETYEQAQARVEAALDPVLNRAAQAAVPAAAPKGAPTSGAKVSGWSMVCRQVTK
jgi:hypothetical protein